MHDRSTNPFPEWLLGIDPVLRRAESNGIYQAFRIRRREHGGRGLTQLRRLEHRISEGGPWVWIIGLGAFFLGLWPLLLIWFLFRAFSSKSRDFNSGRHMPLRATTLMSAAGPWRDVWLAGVNGFELAEAMYLERRENAFSTSLAIPVIIFFISGIVFVFASKPLSPHSPFFFAALIFFAYELFKGLVVGGIHEARVNLFVRFTNTVRRTLGYESIWTSLKRYLKDFLKSGLGIILVLVYITFNGYGIAVIRDATSEWNVQNQALELIVNHHVSLVIACNFILLGLALRYWRKWYIKRAFASLRMAMRDAGYYVDLLYGAAVEQDADIFNWGEFYLRSVARKAELDSFGGFEETDDGLNARYSSSSR